MATLHSNIPPFYCLIRKEFLYNLESHHGEYEKVCVFVVTSHQHLALTFTVMTKSGAQFTKIPIDALCLNPRQKQELSTLQPWSCFSYNFSIIQYEFLKHSPCNVFLKDGKIKGNYLWTIDWFKDNQLDTGFCEVPDAQKTAHFIQLENGNYCLIPNNRIIWKNPDWVTEQKDKKDIDYKTNTHIWKCEE